MALDPTLVKCLGLVLDSEGGWNAEERTYQGIEDTTYAAYLSSKGRPYQSVRKMTVPERDEIYAVEYALPIHFSALPPGLNYCMLDESINSGPGEAVKQLQEVLQIHVDGKMGFETINAVRHCEPIATIDKLCAARLTFMRSLKKKWVKFGGGWTKRVNKVRAQALRMAGAQEGAISAQQQETTMTSGVGTGVFGFLAILAGAFGQPALAHVFQDPSFAANCMLVIGSLSSVVAGFLPGHPALAK
jgi:lysozyme family protein